MAQRPLSVRNKIGEGEEKRIITRSIAKRSAPSNFTDGNENEKSKKAKVDTENVDPRKKLDEKVEKTVEKSSEQIEDEEDEKENEIIDYPRNAEIFRSASDEHPTNKQYLIFRRENGETKIVSKSGLFWSTKFIQIIPHVYPDAYGMFIHNDFSSYGELEIVENFLLDLTKTIFIVKQKSKEKINFLLAFRRIEAFNYLLEKVESISDIDDGDRFYQIMRLIAACYVTILRGLLPKEIFQKHFSHDQNLIRQLKRIEKKIPNFKEVLERSLIVANDYLQVADVYSSYTTILSNVYKNWVLIMENETIDLNEKPSKEKEELWKSMKRAAQIEIQGIETGGKESFDFLKEINAYRRKYGLGGDSHDLRKWSKSQRNQYSFNNLDYFERFWF